jgi:hypothetical protein
MQAIKHVRYSPESAMDQRDFNKSSRSGHTDFMRAFNVMHFRQHRNPCNGETGDRRGYH